jgi:methylthioribulose-1-phosphate dehydratase
MTPAEYPQLARALCDACKCFGERGWCRATSGNFSARIDEKRCLITQSGRQKSRLSVDDLMVCGIDGTPANADCRPSAETPLHNCLYRLDPAIGAVLHTHSINSTLLSRHCDGELGFSGFEMQKAFAGILTHETPLSVHIFDNDQDMPALAEKVIKDAEHFVVPGFLIKGHGLYAWGSDIAEAERHIEGFEFLFECLWQERLAGLS